MTVYHCCFLEGSLEHLRDPLPEEQQDRLAWLGVASQDQEIAEVATAQCLQFEGLSASVVRSVVTQSSAEELVLQVLKQVWVASLQLDLALVAVSFLDKDYSRIVN